MSYPVPACRGRHAPAQRSVRGIRSLKGNTMRTALMGGVLAVAVTLGGVAPAFASEAGSTAPAPLAIRGTARDGGTLTVDGSAVTSAGATIQWLLDGTVI